MYTTNEVDEAVAKLIRTNLRRQYGALGTRRVDATFDDLRDAAVGVFLVERNTPYYVVKLACDVLAAQVASEQNHLARVITMVRSLGRRVSPVSDLSPLKNAQAGLRALASAASSRTRAIENIEDNAAFQRFDNNAERFLNATKDALVMEGEAVTTPSEARSMLGTALSELKEMHVEVLRRLRLIANAIEDYKGMALPALFSSTVLSNAQSVLDANIAELESLTSEDRLKILRRVVLDILAAQSTLRGFASLPSPTLFHTFSSGVASGFADADHPAASAELTANYFEPYTIVDATGSGYYLRFEVDTENTFDTTLQLPGSFIANLGATTRPPFTTNVVGDTGYTNNRFRIQVTNWPNVDDVRTVDVTLTAALSIYTDQVAQEINTALQAAYSGIPVVAEPYAHQRKYSGAVDIDYGGAADVIFWAPTGVDFINIDGFGSVYAKVGDWVIVTDPTASNYGELAAVDAVYSDRLECSLLSGGGANETLKTIDLNEGAMALRIRVSTAADAPGEFRAEAVDQELTISFPAVGPNDDTQQFDTLTTIGFLPVMEVRSRGTSAADIAERITYNAAAASGGVPRLEAAAEFVATEYEGTAYTSNTNYSRLSLGARLLAAVVSYSAPTNTFQVLGDQTALASPGDVLVARSGMADEAEVNAYGTLTAVTFDGTYTLFTADLTEPVDSVSADVVIDVGPDLSSLEPMATLVISTDSPNAGSYEVSSVGSVPLEVTLRQPLPVPVGAGDLPLEVEVLLGRSRVVFKSTSVLLSSDLYYDDVALPVSSNARSRFFNVSSNQAPALGKYVLLPEWPDGLNEGDTVELYLSQPTNTPELTATIVGLEQSLNLVELDEAIMDDADYAVKAGVAPPFLRIRKSQHNNYDELVYNAELYLSNARTAKSPYFSELNRELNQVLVSKNPTPAVINTVVNSLLELSTALQSVAQNLEDYTADAVTEVDTLLASYQEKGADRAVRLLLEASFSSFFGVTAVDSSYAGKLELHVQEVQRQDLPVRKTNRTNDNVAEDVLIASYEDVDYEYDQSDIDDLGDVDIPAGAAGTRIDGGSY